MPCIIDPQGPKAAALLLVVGALSADFDAAELDRVRLGSRLGTSGRRLGQRQCLTLTVHDCDGQNVRP